MMHLAEGERGRRDAEMEQKGRGGPGQELKEIVS